jgi:hypothetical protein
MPHRLAEVADLAVDLVERLPFLGPAGEAGDFDGA